jgi:hypothetical protein
MAEVLDLPVAVGEEMLEDGAFIACTVAAWMVWS